MKSILANQMKFLLFSITALAIGLGIPQYSTAQTNIYGMRGMGGNPYGVTNQRGNLSGVSGWKSNLTGVTQNRNFYGTRPFTPSILGGTNRPGMNSLTGVSATRNTNLTGVPGRNFMAAGPRRPSF